MKINIIVLITFFNFFFLVMGFSQAEWFRQDAVWYYSSPYSKFESKNCIESEIGKDTAINGLSCKVLTLKNCDTGNILAREYVHFRNDSVRYFNYYENEFDLLYDFNAKRGDTIVVNKSKFRPTQGFLYNDSIDGFEYIVLQIDSVSISNHWLKRQKVKAVKSSNWGFASDYDTASYIIERIGSTGYFFGRLGYITMEESIGMVRCYEDNLINFKNTNWNYDCDFFSLIKEANGSLIRLYPNPCFSMITIESIDNKLIHQIEIVNMDGRLLKVIDINKKSCSVDLEDLEGGYYFVRILFNDNSRSNHKILNR